MPTLLERYQRFWRNVTSARAATLPSANYCADHSAAIQQRQEANRPWKQDEIDPSTHYLQDGVVLPREPEHVNPGMPAAHSHYPPADYDNALQPEGDEPCS